MKKLTLLLTLLIATVACSKFDDTALWEKINAQEQRIAALEAWSKTVNANITALQALVNALEAGDYITGVTPTTDGYIISFLKGSPITIKHGEKGDKGDTPLISARQDTDGKLYWTIDSEWLLDGGGNKIPLTGVAPQIRINADTDEWEISTDGGNTWVTTGVKATGDKGDRGDAIFAPDGIDTSKFYYVVFTLADGVTTITLPRYREMGISITQPEPFTPNQTRTVDFVTTGQVNFVQVVNVPAGWTITVNRDDSYFEITAPASIAEPWYEVPVLVYGGDGRTTVTFLNLYAKIDPTNVALNAESLVMMIGASRIIQAMPTPSNATTKYTWESSDEAVATVSPSTTTSAFGDVTVVGPGTATITVTTVEGGRTATCSLRVVNLALNNIEWAEANVDDYQAFASQPDMRTQFYQWNRTKAWAAEGEVALWPDKTITDPAWTENPCPTGWRLPTSDEFTTLGRQGATRANAGTRGNAVSGLFVGPKHATCTLPDNMANCIFLPFNGHRDINGTLQSVNSSASYWTSTATTDGNGYYMSLGSYGGSVQATNKNTARNVRCVRE